MQYPNGQITVLPGGNDSSGDREGVWVYYKHDGSVYYEEERDDGTVFIATGVYHEGIRIRLPTAEELEVARVKAEKIMRAR